jgi:hypothetical protein
MYEYIAKRLYDAGYEHLFMTEGRLDMSGISLEPTKDE